MDMANMKTSYNSVVPSSRPTIGVILPMLSGFYMGEINATLRCMAKQHNVNLLFIRSGEKRDFDLPIGIEHLDALLVVLHAASSALVERFLAQDIPVLSIGASYAPLAVEQFESRQSDGVVLLYQWLMEQGHSRIGFCGDLSVNDVRSRLKGYQSAVYQHHGQFNVDDLFCVSNCSLAGGREAAVEFMRRKAQCTAIICATDHNAIGLIEQLKHQHVDVPREVAVVGVDNIFMGQQVTPPLTTLDQQLECLIQTAFLRALQRISGAPFSRHIHLVDQKLIIRQSCGNRHAAQQTPDNVASIRHHLLDLDGRTPAEVFENFYSQAQNGFQSILDAHSLYGNQLEWACLAQSDNGLIRVESWVKKGMTKPVHALSTMDAAGPITEFPFIHTHDHFVATVIPIFTGRQQSWQLITVVDDLSQPQHIATQYVFNNYLDMLALFIERDALLKTSTLRQLDSKQLLQQLKVVSNSSNDGIWQWDLNQHVVRFNQRLINMLGYKQWTPEHDVDVESLFELIHEEDLSAFESQIDRHLNSDAPFKIEFRLRHHDQRYLWVLASGAIVYSEQQRVRQFIGSMTDITNQKENVEKIHRMAYFDALTGLGNRRKIREEIATSIRHFPQQRFALMLMDLNRFKLINDSFGHHVGDALLCHVSQALLATLEKQHSAARLGGDEFLVFYPIERPVQAIELASQILRAIEKPMCHEDIVLTSQASIGIAFYPEDGHEIDDLIKCADAAMYQAKRLGGRKVVQYSNQMQLDAQSTVKVEYYLNLAIARDELEVHYQPQLCSQSQQVMGVEALARWNSPQLGQVLPEQFISIAENSDMINKLGDSILHRVCRDIQSSAWLRSLKHIAINISAKQLIRRSFADELLQTILQYQLPLSLFCIEITETAAIQQYELCISSLNKLREAGVTISLDDFGTGFSSLSMLKMLPLNEIKIDRSFIFDLGDDPAQLNFVGHMIGMGRSLGYEIVVEGVETQEHVQHLSGFGLMGLQGYYFSRPRPLSDLEQQYKVIT